MFRRRGRFARRKLGQALVPAAASGLPSIFLGEMPRPERKLPPVYLCESGPDGASCRIKWLASTCLAGMVGGVVLLSAMSGHDPRDATSAERPPQDYAAPLAVPRWSGTIVEPEVGEILARYGLSPDDFRDPHAVETRLAAQGTLAP